MLTCLAFASSSAFAGEFTDTRPATGELAGNARTFHLEGTQ
jgi:hypothetical protein